MHHLYAYGQDQIYQIWYYSNPRRMNPIEINELNRPVRKVSEQQAAKKVKFRVSYQGMRECSFCNAGEMVGSIVP